MFLRTAAKIKLTLNLGSTNRFDRPCHHRNGL